MAKQPTSTLKVTGDKTVSRSDNTLKKVLGMHKEWQSYRSKLLKDWSRDNKLYNNERVSKNRYEGVSDTFVPMTFSTIETMVAALATADLNTDFLPQDIYKYLKDRLMPGFDPASGMTEEEFLITAIKKTIDGGVIEDETLEVLNALYDYYWDSGDWDVELEHLIRSGLKIGNGSWWLTWEKNCPKLTTVPFPDFIFDPKASCDDDAKFMGRRYLADLSDLKKETILDPKTGKTVKRYSGLDKVTKMAEKGTGDKSDKEMKEELLFGSTLDISGDEKAERSTTQVEVIEIMTNDRYYTVVNRQILAEDTDNPFKAQAALRGIEYKGIIPGITWSNYKDESLLVGKSETKTFWQEQERLNDVTNQKSDAVTRALLQQKVADPQLKAQSKAMLVNGAVIWGKPDQFQNVPQAEVPNAAFNEEASIKSNIREVTATDQIVKGVGQTEGDITATEAKLQVAQSGQRIELKIKSLERHPLKRLAKLTLEMVKLFIENPFIVPQKANNGILPLLFDPAKYQMDFEPKVKLSIDAQVKKRQEQQSAIQAYEMLIQDPTNNLEEIKKILLPKIVDVDKDEINRIITPAQQPVPEAGMETPVLPEELPMEAMA